MVPFWLVILHWDWLETWQHRVVMEFQTVQRHTKICAGKKLGKTKTLILTGLLRLSGFLILQRLRMQLLALVQPQQNMYQVLIKLNSLLFCTWLSHCLFIVKNKKLFKSSVLMASCLRIYILPTSVEWRSPKTLTKWPSWTLRYIFSLV